MVQHKKVILFLLGFVVIVGLSYKCSGSDKDKKNVKTSDNRITPYDAEKEKALKEKADIYFSSISSLPKEEIAENKIALGKKLFFDKRLSKNNTISCNSCHNLDTYGVDNLSLSPGDTKELGARNSPTVIHAHLHSMQFWDGRAKDVEEQAGGPLLNLVEHSIPSEEFLEERLRGIDEYQKLFSDVYSDSTQPITFATITNAIGAFERQLTPESRFDQWLDGKKDAITDEEKHGLALFIDNGCTTCHSGSALGGAMLQKFGVYGDYWDYTRSKIIDSGLYALTKEESDLYKFKAPGLRNVEKTYPYFHDGSVEKLEDAVRIMGKLQLDKELSEEDVASITAFLKTLTAEVDEKYKE